MNVINQSQELVEVSELLGRDIKIYLMDDRDFEGILHSITNYGVLVKEDEDYCLYPWHIICCIVHSKEIIKKTKEKNVTETDKIEITTAPMKVVDNLLPEDYESQWEDDELEEKLEIYDNEGERVIDVNINLNIIVYDEKDMNLAKKIAVSLNMTKIVKDF